MPPLWLCCALSRYSLLAASPGLRVPCFEGTSLCCYSATAVFCPCNVQQKAL